MAGHGHRPHRPGRLPLERRLHGRASWSWPAACSSRRSPRSASPTSIAPSGPCPHRTWPTRPPRLLAADPEGDELPPMGYDRGVTAQTVQTVHAPGSLLTAPQADQLGRDLDALRERVLQDRGDRRRGLHPSGHRDPAQPRARPAGCCSWARRRRSAWWLGTDLAGARQDPRQHGDRAQRAPRAVGLDARPEDPLHHVGLGPHDAAGPVAAVPQPEAPHLHEHPRRGQRPRLRHPARRRGAALATSPPRAAPAQPGSTPWSSSTASRRTTSSWASLTRRERAATPPGFREDLRRTARPGPASGRQGAASSGRPSPGRSWRSHADGQPDRESWCATSGATR